MKFDEISAWVMILGSSIGMIKISANPIPEYIPKWLEWAVTFLLMAQFIWAVKMVRKHQKR